MLWGRQHWHFKDNGKLSSERVTCPRSCQWKKKVKNYTGNTPNTERKCRQRKVSKTLRLKTGNNISLYFFREPDPWLTPLVLTSMTPDTRPVALRAIHPSDAPHLHLNSRKEATARDLSKRREPPSDPGPHVPRCTAAPTAPAYSAPCLPPGFTSHVATDLSTHFRIPDCGAGRDVPDLQSTFSTDREESDSPKTSQLAQNR